MSGSNVAGGAQKVVGMILAAVIGFPLLIFLVAKLFTSGPGVDLGQANMTNEAISARLQAVGAVKLVEGGPPGSRSGKAVYESVCMSCHATGMAGSPKFGDAGAWAARIAKGFDTLTKHAIEGFNAMPARGGATDLTDDEVKRAVAYMGNAGGAKFEEPKVAAAAGGAIDPAVKGKEIYDSVCMACHATGISNAPKFGDKAAWAPRLKDGADAAIAIGIKGLNAMPPKGGYQGSDDEFKAAALYMINAAK
ncbi:c-type cytochrome [Chitiniphilus shinanonensis]|uniref:c-type cytochrome n=1 Tax=Chitiniphilus shinanonensis TaxID=553088 RepID=UPI00306D4D37